MSTSELSRPDALLRDRAPSATAVATPQQVAIRALSALASLRLTVVLFAMAIFLVFVGTLAQKDHDVWEVVNDTYFRVWWARIDFLAFQRLAQMFFKGIDWNVTGGFYFPGGKLIGSALLINLFAAHAVRFKIAASGIRLAIGLGIVALGALLTALVIHNGSGQVVVSELSPTFYSMFWNIFRASLAGLAFTGAYILIIGFGNRRSAVWWMLLGLDLTVGLLAGWFLINRDFRLDDASLRILWQMLQATAPAAVLLAGCVLVFRRRAGIVLLHAGVAVVMIGELWVAMTASESRMEIAEGSTANYSSDIRTTELAISHDVDATHEHTTVVPQHFLVSNVGDTAPIEHAELPFAVRVHRWLPNSAIRQSTPQDTTAATAGAGQNFVADEVKQFAGVGEDAGRVDIPAAYVELISPEDQKSLGTYLITPELNNQTVEVGGRKYNLSLRFKRIYYPFSLMLKDFRFDRYTGTNTAKNYSSEVQLIDPRNNVDRDLSISMNNPLRYDGRTFYQSDFDHKTEKGTILQVVSNPSWMASYVAFALVALGMLAHFGVMLFRFLRRRADEAASPLRNAGQTANPLRRAGWPTFVWWFGGLFPGLVVALFGVYLLGKTHMPHSAPSEAQIYEFAKLPLAYQGRIKPYDTLARNTLQILSGRQELIVVDKEGRETREPAIRWLLEAIANTDKSRDYRVFRIENLDLLETLGLKPRAGFRYSLNEIQSKPDEMDRQIDLVSGVNENQRTLYDNKVIELATKRNLYTLLVVSFQSPPLSSEPDQINASLEYTRKLIASLRANQSPHAVPPTEPTGQWTPLMEAEFQALFAQATNQPVNPATVALSGMLGAYRRDDATGFNKHLADYRRALADYERSLVADASKLKAAGVANSEILHSSRVAFEVFYNQFSPFYYAAVLYVVAFLLGVFSWIGWTEPLRRASMWLLVMTLALNTLALVGRIYISGRPPVTNLYSATIFFGWAGVLLALIFEWIYRLGLGNIAAAVIGFLTLVVANNLSLEGGDTFTVLQAVLDTQFWLATHVVTVNLGYGATVAAGLWGILYILMAHVFPVLDDNARRQLLRVTYGTLCFAIFFSFVGTVLGGLWADDSWGRFWGWDPKENGALIIVLWNALVLHARWGGIVKSRGFATLAVGGNIAVAWSGFGVNEFGVGLHSYGASEGNTAMWILVFVVSQLLIMALGAMPPEWFHRTSARAA
jgi:ABC-type transport system involved in cytochrome c biogenesis permease subunit